MRQSKISKNLIYHYFVSKEQLFIAVLESAYEKIEAEKAKAPAEQPAAGKNAPEAAKKPGWFSRFVNSRGFQTFLKALGTELIRGMFGGGGRRRR